MLAYLEGMLSLVWCLLSLNGKTFLKNIAFHQSHEASIHHLILSQPIFEQKHKIKEFSFWQLHKGLADGEWTEGKSDIYTFNFFLMY